MKDVDGVEWADLDQLVFSDWIGWMKHLWRRIEEAARERGPLHQPRRWKPGNYELFSLVPVRSSDPWSRRDKDGRFNIKAEDAT